MLACSADDDVALALVDIIHYSVHQPEQSDFTNVY